MGRALNKITNKIDFEYVFTSNKEAISNKQRRDVPSILVVDALFVIKINNKLFFKEEIAILEFYKSLLKWTEITTDNQLEEFHYYTIEYDEYENGSLLSLVPYSDTQAGIKSIWSKSESLPLFNLDYIVTMFFDLERNLSRDIENYFNIDLNRFIQHIPYISRLGD